MDMSLGKLWELVTDREVWLGAVHEVTKSQTQLSNWTELFLGPSADEIVFTPRNCCDPTAGVEPVTHLHFTFSSVQFSHSVVSNTFWPHESQHAMPPCPSPTPRVYSNSCPLSQWCHPTISSSVIPFSSSLQSFPASVFIQMSQLFTTDCQSIGASASASALPMNIQDWFPLGWTGLISLQSKGLARVFSNTTVQKHQFCSGQLSLQSNSHIHTWLLEKPQLWLDGPLLVKISWLQSPSAVILIL